MKAIVFPAPRQLSVETLADPTPAADEVVVKVARSGICGTDIHIYQNEYMSDFPLTPGHEFSGEVVAMGSGVNMNIKIGDRVAVDPNLYCMHCDFCRNGMANHCLNWQGIGVTRAGGFAEYVTVPARACYHLPESMTDKQAAFIEPLSCVVYALQRFPVSPADNVLIIGAGPMGMLLVQSLRHGNAANITVVEKQPARLELTMTMGATHTVLADEHQSERLKEIAPYGFDVVIDATGIPKVIERAFQYLKPRGKFLQFGVAPMGTKIEISPYEIFKNDWTIVGSFALCYTFIPAIEWLANSVVDIEPLVSHTIPLSKFGEAFGQFRAG
ncbi:MAG: zinc-dependent alcohol dehydrogenase family protein, partial [Chloroflexota bacterium]